MLRNGQYEQDACTEVHCYAYEHIFSLTSLIAVARCRHLDMYNLQ